MGEHMQGPVLGIGAESSQFDAVVKKMGESLDHFGHAMHAVEGALGFDKVKEFFGEISREVAQAEGAQRKFEAALSATGKAANPQAFYDLAESLEKTTTFSNTATVEAGAMLARFKVGQTDISNLIPHIQDLSAALGTDFVGSADAMGRAIATGSEGLRALGLGFTASEKQAFQLGTQQERVAMLTEKMAQFQGMAAAQAKTAAGAQQQYHKAMEALHETFGKIIDKPMAEFFQRQTAAVRSLTEWFRHLDGPARDAIAAIGSGILIAGGAAAAMVALSGAVGVLATGIGTLFAVFTGVVLPIAAVAVTVMGLKAAWDANLGDMKTMITGWADAVKQAFAKVVNYLKDNVMGALEKASDLAITAYGWISGKSAEQTGAMLTESHKVAGGVFNPEEGKKAVVGVVKELADGVTKATKHLGKDLADWGSKAGSEMGKWLKEHGIDIHGLGGRETKAKKQDGSDKRDATPISLKDLFAGKPLGLTGDTGLSAGTSMASAMGGGDQGSKEASEFLRAAQKASGVSEQALTTLVDAMQTAGKSGAQILDGVDQFTSDVISAQGAQTQAAINITSHWESAAGIFQVGLAAAQGAMSSIAAKLASGGGLAGKFMTDAMKDPAAAITDIMMQSKSFQNAMAQLSRILMVLAQAFNPLFDSLGPVIEFASAFVGSIVGPLGDLFRALQPAFAALYKGLIYVAIGFVEIGIFFVTIWNGIISALQAVVTEIGELIPFGLGDGMIKWAKSLDNSKGSTDGMNQTIKDLSKTADNLGSHFEALQPPLEGVTGTLNAPQGFAIGLRRWMSIQRGQGDPLNAVSAPVSTTPPGGSVGPPPPSSAPVPSGLAGAAMAIRAATQAATAAAPLASQDVHIATVNVQTAMSIKDAIAQAQAAAKNAVYLKTGQMTGLAGIASSIPKYGA